MKRQWGKSCTKKLKDMSFKTRLKLLFFKKYSVIDWGNDEDYTVKTTFKRMNGITYILKQEILRGNNI